jgi:YcaO-like protein with predicted kinase domain
LKEIGESLGVRRIADITGLDRIGIPVFSAIVPNSNDTLSVYNGKGVRAIDAKVGALMEAIERQTALKTRLPYIESTYKELSGSERTLDPWSVNQAMFKSFGSNSKCAWVQGRDLFSDEDCWVPAHLAGYMWDGLPHSSPFTMTDSNGLASGNNRVEAICQALCELIERDAWTFAEIGAHLLPAMRRRVIEGKISERDDDLEFCPCIEIGKPDSLHQAFSEAGLELQIRDITSYLRVPTFIASVVDESISGFPMAHIGLGCNPNAEVAMRRAITEVAQSRCVDIQSVREDIVDSNAPNESIAPHTRRIKTVDRKNWVLGASHTRRLFEAIESHSHDDVGEDLEFLLRRLKTGGLDQAIVVDFTPDCKTHSVVRVIVPGLERWASDHGRLGPRALAFWKQHA